MPPGHELGTSTPPNAQGAPASDLQVGTRLATRDELRAQWATFQAQQRAGGGAAAGRDDRFDYRGVYMIKAS